MKVVRLVALVLPMASIACGSSDGGSTPAATDTGATAEVAPLEDAIADVAEPVDGAALPPPTAKEIDFEARSPLPSGEQILFNEWSKTPNAVWSMKPDGSGAVEVFRVDRVWSMAASHAADRIVFSCADKQQEKRYGITIGDAIQNTWMYDVGKQTVELVEYGNINDECHWFSPDDGAVFVCRRYDFTGKTNKGWRVGRITLASKSFEFLSDDVMGEYHLGPQPTPDGKQLWYSITEVKPPAPQKQRIVRRALPTGPLEIVREEASRPILSPDGTRYVYVDNKDARSLHVSKLDGSGDVKISSASGTETRFSPDGTRVAYLVFDSKDNCSHVEIVAADGSTAATPTRIRDCKKTSEFITELVWIARK